LVAGAKTGAIVTMEVLVEENVITPVRIILKLLRATIYGAPAVLTTHEYARYTPGELTADLEQVHEVT
jgi:hypothetical protein